jgi:WD40 repeat protein
VLNLPFSKAEVTTLVWSSDNTHLLGFDHQTLFLLDVKGGKKDWVQPSSLSSQGQSWNQILWAPKRGYVAEVGYAGSILDYKYQAVVWDIQSKQRIWTSPPLGHEDRSYDSCALASSGAFVALCQDAGAHLVQIWDIQKNRLIQDLSVPELSLLPGETPVPEVTTLAWSPDNTRLTIISRYGSVQFWDVTSGSHLWTYSGLGQGTSAQWSPDGMALAVWGMASETPETPIEFSETPITMLDARTGKLLFQTSGVDFSSYPINMNGVSLETMEPSGPVVWSSDGKRLALLVYENSTSHVKVCDARTGRLLFTCQPVEGTLTSCSWSPDGRYLAAGTIDDGDNSSIQFWDAQSGQALFSYKAPRAPGQLTWSPDSHLLAVYNPQDYGRMGLHIGFSTFHLQVFEVTA